MGAGGVAIDVGFGVYYSTNITSDPERGIGAWSDAEIEGALRRGVLPGGEVETPVMPYYRYAGMADQDVRDLIAWLRELPPSGVENRPHEVHLPMARFGYRLWRLFFAGSVQAPEVAPVGAVERGRYLTDHVAICGDCHTPRNFLGVTEASMYLAGVKDGPLGGVVPNITPDDKTGVGDWDEQDMVALLEIGMLPDMDSVQGKMAEVIDGIAQGPGYVEAPVADLGAIAAYLKTVPPIAHDLR